MSIAIIIGFFIMLLLSNIWEVAFIIWLAIMLFSSSVWRAILNYDNKKWTKQRAILSVVFCIIYIPTIFYVDYVTKPIGLWGGVFGGLVGLRIGAFLYKSIIWFIKLCIVDILEFFGAQNGEIVVNAFSELLSGYIVIRLVLPLGASIIGLLIGIYIGIDGHSILLSLQNLLFR